MAERVRTYLERRGVELHAPPEERCLDWDDYYAWFTQTLLGLDSEETKRAFWREVATTGHTNGPVPVTFEDWVRRDTLFAEERLGKALLATAAMGLLYPPWLVAGLAVRQFRRLRRRSYYARETARRHRLADARRKIPVRFTANPRPSLADVRAAYARARESPLARLRLGALLEDLERYVDNHAIVERGVPGVRGRAGGIKRLLQREAPELFVRYKYLMSCKALAKRHRQACGAHDPVPALALLPLDDPAGTSPRNVETLEVDGLRFMRNAELRTGASLTAAVRTRGNAAFLRTLAWAGAAAGRVFSDADALKDVSLRHAAEIWRACEGTVVSLEAAIALKIDPDCVPKEHAEDGAKSDDMSAAPLPAAGRKAGAALRRIPRRVLAWIRRRKPFVA